MSSTGGTGGGGVGAATSAARRQDILTRLARVEAAISRWEAYDADRHREGDSRRWIEPPAVPRDRLKEQRRALQAELDQFDTENPPPRRLR